MSNCSLVHATVCRRECLLVQVFELHGHGVHWIQILDALFAQKTVLRLSLQSLCLVSHFFLQSTQHALVTRSRGSWLSCILMLQLRCLRLLDQANFLVRHNPLRTADHGRILQVLRQSLTLGVHREILNLSKIRNGQGKHSSFYLFYLAGTNLFKLLTWMFCD